MNILAEAKFHGEQLRAQDRDEPFGPESWERERDERFVRQFFNDDEQPKYIGSKKINGAKGLLFKAANSVVHISVDDVENLGIVKFTSQQVRVSIVFVSPDNGRVCALEVATWDSNVDNEHEPRACDPDVLEKIDALERAGADLEPTRIEPALMPDGFFVGAGLGQPGSSSSSS